MAGILQVMKTLGFFDSDDHAEPDTRAINHQDILEEYFARHQIEAPDLEDLEASADTVDAEREPEDQ